MTHPFLTALKDQGLAVASQVSLPADGSVPDWIMVMPAGTVRGADGRGPYTLGDPQPVITASVLPGRPLPADFDHQTVFAAINGSTAPAAGWIEQMEAREGAIWAKVDWTESGRQAIASRSYRYISPTFRHDKAGLVQTLASVALTNNPNITELPAIASRVGQGETMDEFLTALRKALGLADDANQDAILQACRGGATATASALAPLITDLGLAASSSVADIVTAARGKLAAGAPDPAQYVPMAAFTELQGRVAELTNARTKAAAETAVASAMRAGKVSPALQGWALGYATQDPAGFEAWVTAAPAVVTPGGAPAPQGDPPGAGPLPDNTVLAVCSQLGIDPATYRAFLEKEKA